MKKRVFVVVLILGMASALFYGCGKNKTPEPVPEPKPAAEEPAPEPEAEPENHDGQVKSFTTGEWIDESLAKMRPYAVMIGNTIDALPQYGISKADVIYEVPVEGAYTRLMAIFQDLGDLEKIGSVRSSRHYFVFFAMEFDAIYVHYGQSIYAVPILNRADVDNISGMDGSIGSIGFYRDKNRKSPHNAFTGADRLKKATEKKGYSTEYREGYEGHYKFAEDASVVVLANGQDAQVISPGYIVNKPWFVYNEQTGLYDRFEFGKEQIDAGAENAQLSVKNILIQYCNWRNKDKNGYLDIDTVGSGSGKYITGGKMIDVTWKKTDEKSPARYYDESGQEITMNQGKTWVCIVQNNYKDKFGAYQTQEELQAARAAGR